MKCIIKSIKWLITFDGGHQVEVEMSADGKEFLSVRPLQHPVGLVFYLNRPMEFIF